MLFKIEKKIIIYKTKNGKAPFIEWMNKLDVDYRERIESRLLRLTDGNYGDCKVLLEGVRELRCHFGSGYRIYFGEQNNEIVILLYGGDKSTQDKDIKKATSY